MDQCPRNRVLTTKYCSTRLEHMERMTGGRWWWTFALLLLPVLGLADDGAGSSGANDARLRTGSMGSGRATPERGFRLRSRTGNNLTHDNHYLFGPSAIPLESGTGYYQNQDILMHSAYFAPVEGLTFGAGVQAWSLITLSAQGSHGPMFHFRVNASTEVGSGFHAGGFVMGARIGHDYELSDQVRVPTMLGMGGAQATFGGDPVNVTLTVGTTAYDGGFSDGPLFGLAALWHISEKVAFITENWHVPLGPGEYRLYSYGARYTHRTMAFDAAFAVNDDLTDFFFLGVPVLGFSLEL